MMKIDKELSKEIYEKTRALISSLQMVPIDKQLGSSCNRKITKLVVELQKFDEVGVRFSNESDSYTQVVTKGELEDIN
jgi:hypothetical protein